MRRNGGSPTDELVLKVLDQMDELTIGKERVSVCKAKTEKKKYQHCSNYGSFN